MFTFILGGPIDPSIGAFALAVGFICICIFASVYIGTRRSRRELDLNHDLALIKERDAQSLSIRRSEQEHEQKMAQLGYRKEVDLAQANAGLIDLVAQPRSNHPEEG